MRLITIFGGYRKQGNTSTVLGWMEEAAREAGHGAERIDLYDLRIEGCRGCYACTASRDEPGCVIDDDAHRVYAAMIEADAIVFGTPLYMWSYAGPLKTFLDRCYCLAVGFHKPDHFSLIEGKPSALVVAAGGSIRDNAEPIQTIFPRWAEYVKLDAKEPWILPKCTVPDKLGEEVKANARRLTLDLLMR